MHDQNDQAVYDVIIAGAGPVGLFLACELRLADIKVLVLEQSEDSHSPLKCLPFGIRGLSTPSIEAFQRRGLLAELIAPRAADASPHSHRGPSTDWMRHPRQPGGHFAGIQFFHDKIDQECWPYRLPSPAEPGMATCDLEQVESVLARRATALGVEIRRGMAVHDLSQSEQQVTVHAGSQRFLARWLVGCDGGRSMVRKAGGFTFAGTEPEFTGYSAQVELAQPHLLAPGRHYTESGMYTYQEPGTIGMVDFDGGACHRIEPITLEHVQAVLRKVSGTAITLTALNLASTWTDRAFQATSYRQGRILLAGDAAHIHSPLGGQGLNLGLGDAINLGWKLAATIQGRAPRDLLDSYQQERHPLGVQILDWSRAQVALMRPTPSTRALAAIIRDLIETRDGATYFAGRVWGMSQRYDLGDAHPLVGRSVPDFMLTDGTRVTDHMHDGNGLLLDFARQASLPTLAARWQPHVRHITCDALDRLGLTAALVRPDGVVAWASDTGADEASLTQAMSRWFGGPRC